MEATTNDFGDSALIWRGGFNCRHVWGRILYKKDAEITNKASANTGKLEVDGFPSGLVPDLKSGQPSTVTSATRANPSPSTVRNLGLSKEKYVEECPVATQDVEVNLRNRQKAIVKAHYGPLNPNEPNEEYWSNKAKMFGGDVESAKKARCGNCAFFVQTKSMLDCISEGIGYDEDPELTIEAGDLGYCEAFDFKCAAARTCDAWVVGGPIVDEDMGYDVGSLPSYVDEVSGDTISKSLLGSFDKQLFQTDEEQRTIVGVAMVPDLKIFRKDKMGNPYYVTFTSETIKMIMEKYMKNQYTRNNDLMHNGKAVDDVYVTESWIKESENDKSTDYGFGSIPVGSWFIKMRIAKTKRGDEVWNQIKEGKLNGFSVSGYFEEVAQFCKEEMFLQQVAKILRDIKE
jgi:hypothetical protein